MTTTRGAACAGDVAKGASVATFVDAAISELDLALRSVGTDRPVSTVFVGGGTPTLLPPQDLVRFLDAVRERWGLADDAEVTTGRGPESDIFLDDVTVSRKHAVFSRDGQGFGVRDVGSLNGTYVNKERIDQAALRTGDEVQIGKFRLVYYASSAS